MAFPDFTHEDLKRRSAHVTLQTGGTITWSTPGMTSGTLVPWQVPEEIMEIIPDEVREHLPCSGMPLIINKNLDLVDLFAGQARITRWAMMAGLNAIAMDKTYGDHMDILTPKGLALIILMILRIKENGLVTAGPQCSSWVWICRKVTQRSKQNPLGNTANASVRDGNHMNKSMALICLLCLKLKVKWLIEQPRTSLFFETPLMRSVTDTIPNVTTASVSLGNFGHMTRKSTLLVGTGPVIENIVATSNSEKKINAGVKAKKAGKEKAKNKAGTKKTEKVMRACTTNAKRGGTKGKGKAKTAETTCLTKSKKKADSNDTEQKLVSIKVREDGSKAITGIKRSLKDSQVYPVKFALAVCKLQWPDKFAV